MLQPVLVRRVGDRWQLISGERRLRAAIRAGWTQVPARVRSAETGPLHRMGGCFRLLLGQMQLTGRLVQTLAIFDLLVAEGNFPLMKALLPFVSRFTNLDQLFLMLGEFVVELKRRRFL